MPSEILLINLQKKMSKEEVINQLSKINDGVDPSVDWIGLLFELAVINNNNK